MARRQIRRRRIERGLGILVPILFVVLWQVVASAGLIDQRFFPPPTTVWNSALGLIGDGVLWSNTWATLQRILLGFFFGVVSGATVGLIMGMSSIIRAALDPLLTALYMVPKLALLPLFMLIFGIGELSFIVLISITVFFFVWLSTMAAFISVPENYREVARSFNASPFQQFRHVLLPAALPDIFVALRLSIGVAVLVVVGVEFVQSSSGLGWMIWNSWQLFLAPRMYVGIVVVAIMGVVLTAVVRWVGRLLIPWARDSGAAMPF
ncbi:ABC transporter permease [Rhodococcus fascians]|nr:ABC transporter permease [Rhodococcus fascians]